MASQEPHQAWRERLAHAFAARVRSYHSRSMVWRLAAPAVFLLAGTLFITSAVSSGGTDLTGTAGRIGDLRGLAAAETRDLEQLRDEHAQVSREVDRLVKSLGDTSVSPLAKEAEALRGPAGLVPVSGPGVTITLDDAPEQVQDTADTDPDNLVVHQQDLQAVANALWAGGAEAMTIQDQRVVSTTGIRCVGNSVVLNDVPYAPPYRISAIGPIAGMLDSVDASPFVDLYLEYVDAYQLGWDVEVEPKIDMPGFSGTTALRYARAAGVLANADGS